MCSYKDKYRRSHVEVEAGRCEGSQADIQACTQTCRKTGRPTYRQQMYRQADRNTCWRAGICTGRQISVPKTLSQIAHKFMLPTLRWETNKFTLWPLRRETHNFRLSELCANSIKTRAYCRFFLLKKLNYMNRPCSTWKCSWEVLCICINIVLLICLRVLQTLLQLPC